MLPYIYNTTLYYPILSDIPTNFDEVTGSPIFTETLQTLSLSMELESPESLHPQIGVDMLSLPVYGRFKEGLLPSAIKPRHSYQVKYQYKPGIVLSGSLILSMDVSSRLGLEKYLGVPFTGVLLIDPNQNDN